MKAELHLEINPHISLRDPEGTLLGKRAILKSIEMIDQMGLEAFNFKKLATEMGSTEATIYRYFENKHKLLVYLMNIYWAGTSHKIHYALHNIENPEKRLRIMIDILCGINISFPHSYAFDFDALRRISVAESSKAYLTKEVDEQNREGYFKEFKQLSGSIAEEIEKLAPGYQYPRALASSLLEMSHHQEFFALHLPSLTELSRNKEDLQNQLAAYLLDVVLCITHGSSH